MCCARALVSSTRESRCSGFLVGWALKKGRMATALGCRHGGLCPAHPPHPPLPRGLSPGSAKAAPLRGERCKYSALREGCGQSVLCTLGWGCYSKRGMSLGRDIPLCRTAYPHVAQRLRPSGGGALRALIAFWLLVCLGALVFVFD